MIDEQISHKISFQNNVFLFSFFTAYVMNI